MANAALEGKKRELEQLLERLHIANSFESVDLTRRISYLTAYIRAQEESEQEGEHADERASMA